MNKEVLKINAERKEIIEETIADETFLTINLDEKELLTLSCTPEKLKELCAGFLYSAGLIHSLEDIETIDINTETMISDIELKGPDFNFDIVFKRVYTSGCGKGVLFPHVLDLAHRDIIKSNFTIPSETITRLMTTFERKSDTYRKTGGVHSAALSSGESILAFSEDIGRHNALDKVIGEALYNDLNMSELLVITSGRISSDVLYKVQKMRSPVIISRSAPTGLAIEIAENLNITLIGFARGRRMNVYTAKERVV